MLIFFNESRGYNLDEVTEHRSKVHLEDIVNGFPAEMASMRLGSQEMLPAIIADPTMAALHDYSIGFLVKANAALLLR